MYLEPKRKYKEWKPELQPENWEITHQNWSYWDKPPWSFSNSCLFFQLFSFLRCYISKSILRNYFLSHSFCSSLNFVISVIQLFERKIGQHKKNWHMLLISTYLVVISSIFVKELTEMLCIQCLRNHNCWLWVSTLAVSPHCVLLHSICPKCCYEILVAEI